MALMFILAMCVLLHVMVQINDLFRAAILHTFTSQSAFAAPVLDVQPRGDAEMYVPITRQTTDLLHKSTALSEHLAKSQRLKVLGATPKAGETDFYASNEHSQSYVQPS